MDPLAFGVLQPLHFAKDSRCHQTEAYLGNFEIPTRDLTGRCSASELQVQKSGAGERSRTSNLRFTKPLLNQLSYTGMVRGRGFEPLYSVPKTEVLPLDEPRSNLYIRRMHSKQKQSLYFPEEMLQEIRAEAARQDRSLSWIIQRAWTLARKDIAAIPSIDD